MQMNILGFLKEVFADYAKRFWIFGAILYGAIVLLELSRQGFLELLSPSTLFHFSAQTGLADTILLNEFITRPYLLLPLAAMFFFNIWGFGSLYFSFAGANYGQAIKQGFKNVPRYLLFVVISSIITFLGFSLLTGLTFWLIDNFTGLPLYLTEGEALNLWLALPIFVIFGLPGLYFLVAFSNGPFILLLEKKNIFQALAESIKRVIPHWFRVASYLLLALITAGVVYYVFSWLVFALKLRFIPDLSLRGESMLRVFLYSIPWVFAASFYDLALYHLYRRLAISLPARTTEEPIRVANEKKIPLNALSRLSPAGLKIVTIFVLIALIGNFVLFPTPVNAGGAAGGIFRTIFAVVATAVSCVTIIGCAVAITVAVVVQAAQETATSFIGSAACNGLDGSYDPVFGTCGGEGNSTETQDIRTSLNVKFISITYGGVPTPEEFMQNQNGLGRTTVRWKADAPQGISENIVVTDKTTGQVYQPASGTAGVACTQGEYEAIYNLPFDKEFIGEINYSTCIQSAGGRRRREYRAVCSGCGGGGNLVKTEFTSPSLPLPIVDIKANNKDSLTFTPGTPITLSWTSEYALSCTAEGSWSGEKGTSGSQTVVPQTGNEVYTLVCRRGEKTGRDSVSSAPASREIRVFDVSSGSLGGLRISSFNATDVLNPGDTVTISWSVQGAETCEVDNGIGSVPTTGSADVTFLKTTTFTLTCEDKNGNSVSAQKTIQVRKVPGLKEIKPN